jgi:hypothetical protein
MIEDNLHARMENLTAPTADSWHTVLARLTGRPEHEQPAVVYKANHVRR